MNHSVRRSHRLQAKNDLQSLWTTSSPNRLLAWFAHAALVRLLSVATRDLSLIIFLVFFLPLYVSMKRTRFVLSTYE